MLRDVSSHELIGPGLRSNEFFWTPQDRRRLRDDLRSVGGEVPRSLHRGAFQRRAATPSLFPMIMQIECAAHASGRAATSIALSLYEA